MRHFPPFFPVGPEFGGFLTLKLRREVEEKHDGNDLEPGYHGARDFRICWEETIEQRRAEAGLSAGAGTEDFSRDHSQSHSGRGPVQTPPKDFFQSSLSESLCGAERTRLEERSGDYHRSRELCGRLRG